MRKAILSITTISLGHLSVSMTPDPDLPFKAKYTSQNWQQIESYRENFNKTKTLDDFVAVYHSGTKMNAQWAEPFQRELDKIMENSMIAPDYNWTDGLLPGFRLTRVAEGTQMAWLSYWPDFIKLAQKTPSELDDRFAKLKHELHGDLERGFPAWMEQTWDYGGCSYLGSGKHTRFLKEILAQRQPNTPFMSELYEEQERLWNNILNSQDYCGAKKAALSELKTISTDFKWSQTELEALSKTRERLNKQKSGFQQMHSEMGV